MSKEEGVEAEIHVNLFLGELSTLGLDLDSTTVITDLGNEYPMRKVLERTMLDVSPAELEGKGEEPTWVITSFARYLENWSWRNTRGEEVRLEDIVSYANRLDMGCCSCMGTHVMEGIAAAVEVYSGRTGISPAQFQNSPWREAYEKLEEGIKLAKESQRQDGSIRACGSSRTQYRKTCMN